MIKSGILLVYKEKDWTSFDVVAKLRGLLKIRKMGHTGTLDPMAEGLLPICIGKATKVVDILTDRDKTYKAVMKLGTVTDTEDITGRILREQPCERDTAAIRAAVLSFVGEYDQIPPMYSALKQNGKKLYELAREGTVVERPPRKVNILSIDIENIDLPYVTMTCRVSKGTYIRSLCRDVGEKLGCGACLSELIRLSIGNFSVGNALRVGEIEKIVVENRSNNENGLRINQHIMSIDAVFSGLRMVKFPSTCEKAVLNGAAIPLESIPDCIFPAKGENSAFDRAVLDGAENELVRGYLPNGSFVGIYELRKDCCRLKKMFYESDTI